jgi:hydrogenase-4 component F
VTALLIITALLPLAGAISLLGGARARAAGYATAAGGAAALAATLMVAIRVETDGSYQSLGGFAYVDSLSAFFLLTVAAVVALAGLGSAAYLIREEKAGALNSLQIRLYVVFFGAFASMMLASLETGNLGLLWVLIEASTLASAVLVALEARATSLEAAWKYIIISSFGVTIALVGTLFLYYAATSLPLSPDERLTWTSLFSHAGSLQPDSLRLAFLLAVIGYGTKVGLAPMHTWLPDAHSEAPSPASAMLSAALLNTGMYAIIRFQAIAGVELGRYTNRVLLVFGFASIAIGALFMVVQRGNFKRLFAYSSVEHMGIIAVALGFGGPLGMYGALLHTLNHAIGKAVLFLTSGELVARYHTRSARDLTGVIGSAPFVGGALLLGSLAIVGSPPFGPFLSEFTIIRAGLDGSSAWLVALLLVLLVLGFVALLRTTAAIALGEPSDIVAAAPVGGGTLVASAPLVVGLAALLLLGLWIPGALNHLIMHSIGAIT